VAEPGARKEQPSALSSAPRRVLIVKPCCMGDVLMATPLAASLAAAWPAAAIDWAVDRHSRPVLEGNPHIAELVDATGCVRGSLSPLSLARLAVRARRGAYDVAFVPDRSPLMAAVPLAAGVPVRIGLDSGGRGRSHTVRVPASERKHETELYLDLARAVGIPTAVPVPVFAPSPLDREAAAAYLAVEAESAPLVAVHPAGGENPGMRMTEKRWPAGLFAALIDRLAGEHGGARFFLLGGPGDEDTSRAVLAAMTLAARDRTVDLTGALSIGEVGALVDGCDVYVGNDSGAAHLAAAVGTPVVVVFGPTDPLRYGPAPGRGVAVGPSAGDRSDAAVSQLRDARGSRAIEAVSVDRVWEAVSGALSGSD